MARSTGTRSELRADEIVDFIDAAYAIGQSAKETAYALGISDATVRVLLARAAAKLGVKTRAELLDHPEVRGLRPEASAGQQAPNV